ncbi:MULTISPECIES: NAD(P)/FAD-dependent oxidoreductase [Solibacillus]|uniref:NAD(P)/FAD-dependent oxidoreductase n=1 Tax=Solibacillus merdavium TaxID=2762218 RepID=A0ABR8XLX0_9BACL|nr:NAD(P)/FAD-dependent oxidoreductase [Solibacillus merdavium]MBD8032944.1 NAD(P)/FAD-dependent oxidoreductase [Solibacillus merdavium]
MVTKEIVILGAGFAGVLAAQTARKFLTTNEARITVVNQFPTHQIITELHRLAGGTIKEGAVSLSLEKIFKGLDINLEIAKVNSFNVDNKEVALSNGKTLQYDTLVVALGSQTGFFGIPGLEENSFVLKSVDEANAIREHIEARIKAYAKTKDEADATIVIGGGGLTGVELVGEIVDHFPKVAEKYGVKFEDLKIKLVEAGPKILPVFPDNLIERATTSLQKRGVEFITSTPVTGVEGNVIQLKDREPIVANTLVWTGGVAPLPIVGESGLAADRGKATINDFLQSTSHPEVFVIGDASAHIPNPGDRPTYAPTAQVAWQQGEVAGYNIFAQIKGADLKEFKFTNSGTLGSLGRKDGIATIGANNTQLVGLPASLMKEASNVRYMTHIKALFGLAY